MMGRLPDWLFIAIFGALFPVWWAWMEIDKARGHYTPYEVEAKT